MGRLNTGGGESEKRKISNVLFCDVLRCVFYLAVFNMPSVSGKNARRLREPSLHVEGVADNTEVTVNLAANQSDATLLRWATTVRVAQEKQTRITCQEESVGKSSWFGDNIMKSYQGNLCPTCKIKSKHSRPAPLNLSTLLSFLHAQGFNIKLALINMLHCRLCLQVMEEVIGTRDALVQG